MSELQNKKPFNSYWIYAVIILAIVVINASVFLTNQSEPITLGKFEEMVVKDDVKKVTVVNKKIVQITVKRERRSSYPSLDGKSTSTLRPDFTFEIGDITSFAQLIQKLREDGATIDPKYETQTNWLGEVISWMLPFVLLIGLYLFFMRRMSGGQGSSGGAGNIFNIGKSKAKMFDKNENVDIVFKDVAGLDEAKVEIMEVVDFLKRPEKYTALGGKIPKGVLLVAPPGTGKTLLAKAVAGEAEVPFFSISGSDFVEMFVGVGASRVRDLFKQAREKAPCIIFIDEIDAIGRARGKGAMQGGNDERENTLNQLLVEMDGFGTDKGVIIMAATNRPDVLDQALLRPGRFDRQIGIDLPDLKSREAIFEVHLKTIKIGDEINKIELAEMTAGFSGADIANICNEAALVAARNDKKTVDMKSFNYALDRIIGGIEKKSKIIAPKEKKIIAFHEAGHAICGWFLEHASPLVKVTIVPRGIGTLGYAQYQPKEEYITTTEAMLDRICMTMGGRAAERLIFDKISTGAQNDLDQVTKMAYSMVSIYGMSEKVGNVSFYSMSQDSYTKPYSDETSTLIDKEVRKMIEKQYERAQKLLQKKSKELHLLANKLLEKEVILKSDLEVLIGKRPFNDDGPLDVTLEDA